jgi:hypothetical protein
MQRDDHGCLLSDLGPPSRLRTANEERALASRCFPSLPARARTWSAMPSSPLQSLETWAPRARRCSGPVQPQLAEIPDPTGPFWSHSRRGRATADVDKPEAANRVFELGGPDQVSWNEFWERLKKALGVRRPSVHMPMAMGVRSVRVAPDTASPVRLTARRGRSPGPRPPPIHSCGRAGPGRASRLCARARRTARRGAPRSSG